MQDLRAVVRHFRRFLMVQLGDETRIGHDPRVGCQDARHVLPQHHPAGMEYPRQQRGGEIRPATAQGGDAAVQGAPDEAGDDRDDPLFQQGLEHLLREKCGLAAPRGGSAVHIIGADHLQGVNERGRTPCGRDRGGHDGGGQLLASGYQGIPCARRQVPQDSHGPAEIAILGDGGVDGRQHLPKRATSAEYRLRRRMMAVAHRARNAGGFVRAALDRVRGPLQQEIGDASKRRRDDHQRPFMRGNARRRSRDRLAVGQGCTSKLPHLQTELLSSRCHAVLLVLGLTS